MTDRDPAGATTGEPGRSPGRVPGRALGSRALRTAFGVAGLGFLVVAFLAARDRALGDVIPPWWGLALALAVVAAGHAAGAMGWVALLERPGSSRRLVHGLFVAQFGKYIPGGIWQVVGQVGLAVGPEVTAARAAAAFPVHVVVQAAAAAAVGAPLALLPGVPLPVRLAALAALAAIPLLHRRWMAAAAARVRRASGSGSGSEPGSGGLAIPSQPAIVRAWAWSVAGIGLAGLGFALLLASMGGADGVAVATAAFGLAWLAGFLALPVPSGIGVREAVLLATLGSGAALLVAASLVHRLVLMAAEAVLAIVTWRPG